MLLCAGPVAAQPVQSSHVQTAKSTSVRAHFGVAGFLSLIPNDLPECENGYDDLDTEDTLADELDPGCTYDGDNSEVNQPQNDCFDGRDNDGDPYVDGADPGCHDGDSWEAPQNWPPPGECEDGLDNDGDGPRDQADWPDCADSAENEPNPPPSTCADGQDNDGDGPRDGADMPDCADGAEDQPGGGGDPNCPGLGIILWSQENYSGECRRLTESSPDLGDWNEKARSMEVRPDDKGYVLLVFDDRDYQGAYQRTYESDPSLDIVPSSLFVYQPPPNPDFSEGADKEWIPERWGEPAPFNGPPAGIGCNDVGDALRFENSRDRVLWTFALRLRFCWNGLKITKIYNREKIHNIPDLPPPHNVFQGWEYDEVDWMPGDQGEYTAIVKLVGRFKFCSFHFACAPGKERFVRIVLTAAGDATCQTTVRPQPHDCWRW